MKRHATGVMLSSRPPLVPSSLLSLPSLPSLPSSLSSATPVESVSPSGIDVSAPVSDVEVEPIESGSSSLPGAQPPVVTATENAHKPSTAMGCSKDFVIEA